MKTLVIDGDNLFKIGVFGLKDYFNKGQHIGGIFHFLNTIKRHLEKYNYDKIVVFWDGDNNHSLRKATYVHYKENRNSRQYTDEEETSNNYQRNRIKSYLEELFIRQGEYENVESDDCIAYYCLNTPNETKTIFSGDVDLTQLISEKVNVFSPKTSSFITISDKIIIDGISIPSQNVTVVKVFCGDSSDNISGIKGMGLRTLVNHFPIIQEQPVTVEFIKEQAEAEFIKNKNIKAINNLLTGTSKYGVFGDEFFLINKKIIELNVPLITEEAKVDINELITQTLDPEDRGWKNLIKMMMEDGILKYLPKQNNAWTHFLGPLLNLARKEKKLLNNKKN